MIHLHGSGEIRIRIYWCWKGRRFPNDSSDSLKQWGILINISAKAREYIVVLWPLAAIITIYKCVFKWKYFTLDKSKLSEKIITNINF